MIVDAVPRAGRPSAGAKLHAYVLHDSLQHPGELVALAFCRVGTIRNPEPDEWRARPLFPMEAPDACQTCYRALRPGWLLAGARLAAGAAGSIEGMAEHFSPELQRLIAGER